MSKLSYELVQDILALIEYGVLGFGPFGKFNLSKSYFVLCLLYHHHFVIFVLFVNIAYLSKVAIVANNANDQNCQPDMYRVLYFKCLLLRLQWDLNETMDFVPCLSYLDMLGIVRDCVAVKFVVYPLSFDRGKEGGVRFIF
ncbi:hypothetical protein ACJX0J_025547, partial [Zea mays]